LATPTERELVVEEEEDEEEEEERPTGEEG